MTTGLWHQIHKFVHWNGTPSENVPWDGIVRNAFPMGQYYISELSLSETVGEQEINNLLNENSDSEYECQNDNELRTIPNFKVNKVNKFFRFVSLFVRVVLPSTLKIKLS